MDTHGSVADCQYHDCAGCVILTDKSTEDAFRSHVQRESEYRKSCKCMREATVKRTSGNYCVDCDPGPFVREQYRCQFCEAMTPAKNWKGDKCPECRKKYDPILAQEGDD